PEMTEPDLLNQAISDTYDETPYTSNAFAQTAPGHLQAVAHLYGLDSAPLEKARVLELGSAAGGNLIPFAAAYPDADV
ncbi:methyltransferase, partial [Burkholderia sp. SIMBA_019]